MKGKTPSIFQLIYFLLAFDQEIIIDCQEIVCSLCDLLHSRCTKILNIRAKVIN